MLGSVGSVTLLKLAYSHIFPLITHAPMDCDKALPDLHHQIRALHKNKSGFGDGKTSTRRINRKRFFKKRYEIVSSCKINMVEKNILALIFDWKITATKRRLPSHIVPYFTGNKGNLIDPFLFQERLASHRSEIS